MNKKYSDLLQKFQCEYNRMSEETFAQTLSENENVRLFFINENRVFTDGKNIIVDPAEDELFTDRKALDDTSEFLDLPKVVLADSWNVLKIITRAQTIHECLHLLYTDFPLPHLKDPRCDTLNKKLVMGMISNVIEDSYIEAVGCSYYDNMDFYLKFGRVARLFANNPSEGTVDMTFGRMVSAERKDLEARGFSADRTNSEKLTDYLNYMGTFLLYPMVIQRAPSADIAEYVEKSKPLFLKGSVASSPDERYRFSSEIFGLIEHFIPDDEEELDTSKLELLLIDEKTHSGEASSLNDEVHKGRTQTVTTRLFTDIDGNEKKNEPQTGLLMSMIQSFAKDRESAEMLTGYSGSFAVYTGKSYDCAVLHNHIKINENHPKINLNLKKAYQNIYNKYRINIRSYNNKFTQLLKAKTVLREEKFKYGSGITSTRLGDPQKRYWYRSVQGEDVPDMSVMLLIDGSGSMRGERRAAAMQSAVILHEVLKKQNISHAVVEHRAEFDNPEIDVNILVSFNGREEEKYNLMQIEAYGDNRDGLALFWAEKYMQKNTASSYRLIIVLSDGVPAHEADDYYPPVSTKDTANAVRKITKRGTDIIAVSLDSPDSFDCYDALSEIYPNIIACNDLNRLTGQLLGIITKIL